MSVGRAAAVEAEGSAEAAAAAGWGRWWCPAGRPGR